MEKKKNRKKSVLNALLLHLLYVLVLLSLQQRGAFTAAVRLWIAVFTKVESTPAEGEKARQGKGRKGGVFLMSSSNHNI